MRAISLRCFKGILGGECTLLYTVGKVHVHFDEIQYRPAVRKGGSGAYAFPRFVKKRAEFQFELLGRLFVLGGFQSSGRLFYVLLELGNSIRYLTFQIRYIGTRRNRLNLPDNGT